MSNLQPYVQGPTASRTSRALARLSDGTDLAMATTQARADIEAAKLDGVAAVAGRALQNVALLSQMEQSLARAVPHASGRLASVADLAALSMADVVATAARGIGR